MSWLRLRPSSSASCTAACLFISLGDGTFAPVRTLTSGGQGVLDVAIGDMNRDGRPDLAVAIGSGTGEIGLFFNRGDDEVKTKLNFVPRPRS